MPILLSCYQLQSCLPTLSTEHVCRYKIGDSFFILPLSEVQELLASDIRKAEDAVTTVEERLGEVKEEMQQLKIALYARFGKGINLET